MSIWKANKWTNKTDKVMTKEDIAIQCINILKPFYKDTDTFLEPCRWTGNFFNSLPLNKKWCEIDEWKDFFNFEDSVDWIITNPPYSIYESFVDKCFKVSDNVALLMPLAKPFSSLGRIKKIRNYWWIHTIFVFPFSASKAWFPFWFPLSLTYFKKWYNWKQEILFL